MDLSSLHNSVEAITAETNFKVALLAIAVLNQNYDQLADANDYGAAASRFGAEANRNNHNEMSNQLMQQCLEHSIHAGTNGMMAGTYAVVEARSLGETANAQKKADYAQAYLDALEQHGGELHGEAVDVKKPSAKPGSAAEKGADAVDAVDAKAQADLTAKQKYITSKTTYKENDPTLFEEKNGKWVLKPDAKQAIETLPDNAREKMLKDVRRDHSKAEKAVTNIESKKSQFYDKVRVLQQLTQTAASAGTEANRAVMQELIGKYEFIKGLMQGVEQASQLTQQISMPAITQARELLTGVFSREDALAQANRAA